MDASLKSYILRIYRFDRKKPGSLVGLAEEVGAKEKRAFTNLQELWDILRDTGKGPPAERTKKKEVMKKPRSTIESGMKSGKDGRPL